MERLSPLLQKTSIEIAQHFYDFPRTPHYNAQHCST
jgi:hypothetical protein